MRVREQAFVPESVLATSVLSPAAGRCRNERLQAQPAIVYSTLVFIINASSGSSAPEDKRAAIEGALAEAGRCGELRFTRPADLAQAADEAALTALQRQSAMVGVGGDGTISAVAQAAHAHGCAMGLVPQGTFNYFACTHGLPEDAAQATRVVLRGAPVPVQVGVVNEQLFLVNASLGLYPEMLKDREAYTARFGRHRLVVLFASATTLLRSFRPLRLSIRCEAQSHLSGGHGKHDAENRPVDPPGRLV